MQIKIYKKSNSFLYNDLIFRYFQCIIQLRSHHETLLTL